jgi:V/A-type H+/Na+-transporting ATPase subunit A
MSGRIVSAAGPVIRVAGLDGVAAGEVVRVGRARLLGEVLSVSGDTSTVQVHEETAGLRVDDPVEATGAPLLAELGPGLLGSTFDGLQRPLDTLAAGGTARLRPGIEMPALDDTCRWPFTPARQPGDEVGPGDVLGTVLEGPIEHRIMLPPGAEPGVIRVLDAGDYTIADAIGTLETARGSVALSLAQTWPIRLARPVGERLGVDEPLVTGQRIIDMLFPVAKGGTAVIPGGFGTGKTVVEQAIARWSDAEIVVYVGCGERGNEMAELLDAFPELEDPRTGRPLLERTVLIANTSNMPVAAREASVQLGVTIAEYYRDQGYDVALLADSTSRWAEALREISGRLEELPGEEGYPAYLGSRLAAFYERAGRVVATGEPTRRGSLTVIGAVSPPGGDFSEPVTQASLRLAGTFWALDTDLAHARHFPAISWTRSYSLYVAPLRRSLSSRAGADWESLRAAAVALLARERQLLEIVQLVGPDALPDEDRILLEEARILRETFLRQHAFDPVDASRPPAVQLALLRAVLAAHEGMRVALERGASLTDALADPLLGELQRATALGGDGVVERLEDLARRIRGWTSAASDPAVEAVVEVPA